MADLLRYPRTAHLTGSRLQAGDTTHGQIAVASLPDGEQVWEEKLDGSNTAISFDDDATLLLQSRGHFLTGGASERQYNLFKAWAQRHLDALFDLLQQRYIMYGEWMFAKHTVFYDDLPHYFFEFDIYDRTHMQFLSTPARQHLLGGSPVVSVPIVHVGRLPNTQHIRRLIQPSRFKTTAWQTRLTTVAQRHGIAPQQAVRETDPSSLAEGLYLKVERDDTVIGRYKFIRPDFLQTILDAGSHWATRPILPNQLAADVDIFV